MPAVLTVLLAHLASRPAIMGIVNVTPDSFSDGGRYDEPDAACAHAAQLLADGADILDIGGESSRPGAKPVSAEEEWRRVEPVIRAWAGRAIISIDTVKAEVARAALEAGAEIVNDISAGTRDPAMLATVAAHRGAFIAMHMKGAPETMQRDYLPYDDVVSEVRDYLRARVAAARQAGVQKVFVDPGIGFGKSFRDNWRLLAELSVLNGLGDGVVFGASRKKFLSEVVGSDADLAAHDQATALTSLVAMCRGARIIRVHAPAACRLARDVASRLHNQGD